MLILSFISVDMVTRDFIFLSTESNQRARIVGQLK